MLWKLSVLVCFLLTPLGLGEPFEDDAIVKQQFSYQSDVGRMRNIVINSLYSHREVFLRELISNANDALEKLRLLSLTDKNLISSDEPLNITIKAIKDEKDKVGRLVITDTGIGMSSEELASNLGTLAKSGTTEFVSKAEAGADSSNLIGAFGLGFYSSFLVADQVYVASVPPKSEKHPHPQQYVFSSSVNETEFQLFPDPRGNTLGHGTEITLVLKADATHFLDNKLLQDLVAKHSSFSTTYPIFLHTLAFEQLPVEEDSPNKSDPNAGDNELEDNDDAVVEDISDEDESPRTREVTVDKWIRLNAQAPLWMRDPKTISEEEYIEFYKTAFKENTPPLAWHHFQGDSGTGTSFRAIIFIPGSLSEEFWNSPKANSKDIRLLVKRVFITNDLGEDGIAKWASWLKVVVDAEDLPLNVSRETLQSTKFLKQMKQMIVKRLIQLFSKLSEEEPEKYEKLISIFGNAMKLGAVENQKDRNKLSSLIRWHTNQRNFTSLDDYVKNRKEGQKQIFYHGAIGHSVDFLNRSVFVEKINARGYECFLVAEPLDEFLFQTLQSWQGLQFQDAAKRGLLFGDEKNTEEQEAAEQALLKLEYEPLVQWLKNETTDVVRDVIISDRLVTTPCAIVADTYGYSANMERLMNAQNTGQSKGFMHDFAKKQKFLEINPKSPLIEGLLKRVKQLPENVEDRDPEEEIELREVLSILVDGALIRSGFDVKNTHLFFEQIDRVLRRSLGVSEFAKTDDRVKAAPPVDTRPIDPEDTKARVEIPDHLKDEIKIEMEEIPDDEDYYGNKVVEHDEL